MSTKTVPKFPPGLPFWLPGQGVAREQYEGLAEELQGLAEECQGTKMEWLSGGWPGWPLLQQPLPSDFSGMPDKEAIADEVARIKTVHRLLLQQRDMLSEQIALCKRAIKDLAASITDDGDGNDGSDGGEQLPSTKSKSGK